MQYEVTRPSKRLWDRPFVVHALHCAALVRSDCVRHARDCRCSRTKFSVRNRLVAEVWVWLIGSLCRACAVCVGSIAANVLASGTCVWAGQWHKSSASWSRRLTCVDGTVAQNERVLVRCGASHVAVCAYSNPPHRRNRYFRVVETALVLETAVLETRGFLNAAR